MRDNASAAPPSASSAQVTALAPVELSGHHKLEIVRGSQSLHYKQHSCGRIIQQGAKMQRHPQTAQEIEQISCFQKVNAPTDRFEQRISRDLGV